MAMTSVQTSGQWGYPIQGLGSYGGAEEKKPSSMRFTSEHGPWPRRHNAVRHPNRPETVPLRSAGWTEITVSTPVLEDHQGTMRTGSMLYIGMAVC